MNCDIKVTVFCTTYNHEKYIRNALEGFVMQKTNFPFEVLVHDDASTDSTADIIREYEKKYPNIIKPIYQTENQYSKGVKIKKTFLIPIARGEYFAWCEGDDCWLDPLKLQKQVDFLDANPEYSMCSHRVEFRKLRSNGISYIPKIKESRDFSAKEIIRGGALFHITSIMIRSDLYKKKPIVFETGWFGDIQLYIYGAICGKVRVFKDVMSAYNHGVEGSWTLAPEDSERKRNHSEIKIAMFEAVNEYYNYKYNDDFLYAITRERFNIDLKKNDKRLLKRPEYREFLKTYKKSKFLGELKTRLPFLIKIKGLVLKTFKYK